MHLLKKINSFVLRKRSVVSVLNKVIKRTQWYKNSYGDVLKYKKVKFNTSLVVLGSSPAKWAFDVCVPEVECANWASMPQSIIDDFRILKNYHSYLSPNGLVLLFFSHCRGLKKDYGESSHFRNFHYFLHPILNPFYEERVYEQLKEEIDFPIYRAMEHPLELFKTIVKQDLLKRKPLWNSSRNCMDEDQLNDDAEKWIVGWKKEFGNTVFDVPLCGNVRKSIEFNKNVVCEMAEFCKERSLRLVFVVPPVTKNLKSRFSPSFTQAALYDLISPAQLKYGIPLFDYLDDETLQNADFYFNSFFLNKKGRKIFTDRLIKDLKQACVR